MNGIVELSGYSSLGGCAPCGMGAIEVIPPKFESDDQAPSEVVPVRAVTTALVVGAAVVTLTVVGLIWLTRKT